MRLLTATMAAAFGVIGFAAFAQDTVITADAGLVDFAADVLMLVVSAIIAVFLPVVLTRLASKYGLQIEQEKRDALQVTLTNAAGGLIQKLGASAKGLKVDVHNAELADAIARVQRSAPDALKWAGLSEAEIARRILEKVALVTAPNTSVGVGEV
jgi:hypothetical protein